MRGADALNHTSSSVKLRVPVRIVIASGGGRCRDRAVIFVGLVGNWYCVVERRAGSTSFQHQDGGSKFVTELDQQVDVIEVLLATEAVSQVIARVDPGAPGLAFRRNRGTGSGSSLHSIWRAVPSAPGRRSFSRRILSVGQTLNVRPQPVRALRLLQKTRRALSTICPVLSSTPCKPPCRINMPTTLQ